MSLDSVRHYLKNTVSLVYTFNPALRRNQVDLYEFKLSLAYIVRYPPPPPRLKNTNQKFGQPALVAHTSDPSTGWQRQVDLLEFKGGLTYFTSFRLPSLKTNKISGLGLPGSLINTPPIFLCIVQAESRRLFCSDFVFLCLPTTGFSI